MTQALRAVLGTNVTIVLQDHSGVMPRRPRVLRGLASRRWTRAFRDADACTFTAREQAARWHAVGLPHDITVLEIPEASTTFTPVAREQACAITGMTGRPVMLWVGRLDANKDPETVLDGVEAAIADLPEARLWMLALDGDLRARVRRRIDASSVLRRGVCILDPVAHSEMPFYYSSADVLVSGSHHEGSGYALIEGLACGVTPCLTAIPPFRALAEPCGVLWTAGDSDACAAALGEAIARVSPAQRERVRAHFDERLSWNVIGRQTFAAYEALVRSRRRAQGA
jgi:glycosyltransferase involved in cell wall biosynthesis